MHKYVGLVHKQLWDYCDCGNSALHEPKASHTKQHHFGIALPSALFSNLAYVVFHVG